MSDWRVRAYSVQVRIYPDPEDRAHWILYSRHRNHGETARRALVEATNAYPRALCKIVDSKEP